MLSRQLDSSRSGPRQIDLLRKIRGFINGWNTWKRPFILAKGPDELLANLHASSPPRH